MKMSLILAASLALSSSTYAAQMPTKQEMWEMIQLQQQQIKALQASAATTQKQVQVANEKADAAATIAEESSQQANSGTGWWNKTTIGGYGEHHMAFNNNADDRSDAHRFVLFFGHEFTDKLRFFSELEVEHGIAGEGKVGEVEIEQMYIEYDVSDTMSAKAGVMLMPIGIMNETHEPNTFYGVERNSVEATIVPSTWWEAGAILSGHSESGFSWDAGVTSGLNIPTAGGSTLRVRSGRGKSGKQAFDNRAVIGRLKYTGVPGLEVAATLYHQSDASQSARGIGDATLFETHAVWNYGNFGLRALYAQWDIDATATVKAAASGRNNPEDQDGWYLEPSYKFNDNWGIFARFEDVDGARAADEFDQTTIGFNYWLHKDVVLKTDYQDKDFDANGVNNARVINLGVGYQF